MISFGALKGGGALVVGNLQHCRRGLAGMCALRFEAIAYVVSELSN